MSWTQFSEEHQWQERLAAMAKPMSASVAAACSQRALPLYLQWAKERDPEGYQLAQRAQEALWEEAAGQEAKDAGPLFDGLCDHEPFQSDASPGGNEDETDVDVGIHDGQDSLRLAVESILTETGEDLVLGALGQAFQIVEVLIAKENQFPDDDQLDALVAVDSRAQAELKFQEAVIAEVERTNKPLTEERARQLSRQSPSWSVVMGLSEPNSTPDQDGLGK